MELRTNTILNSGKYRIIQKIGQGGFGIVYKAEHVLLDKVVCIKEFYYLDLCERKTDSSDLTIISASSDKINLIKSLKKKFLKEAQRLATFQHPNIVKVTDVFEENNTVYFVMEYLHGGSLHDKLINCKLTEQQTLKIILPVLDALTVLHTAKLLHLDIKPMNIMFRTDNAPVLIDFGISKFMVSANNQTTTAPLGISKGYAPIEQYGGNIADLSEATDIYSVCATMYNMLCGVTPPEPLQILGNGLKNPKDFNPNLSDKLNSLVVKGMSVKANDRYSSIFDLIIELKFEKSLSIDNKRPENATHTSKKQTLKLDKYDLMGSFYSGLAEVRLNSKIGYIDKKGNQIIPSIYDWAHGFKEDANAVEHNGKWGFIDKNGNQIIEFKFLYAFPFLEGLAAVGKQGLFKNSYIYIDKYGNQAIPFSYYYTTGFSEGLALVNIKSKWCYIDKQGNKITPCKFDDANNFSEGLASVKLNDKWGFVDKNGNQVLPCRYDDAKDFSEGLAYIELNGKGGFIDKNGNQIVPCKYEGISRGHLLEGFFYPRFSEGLACMELNRMKGFVDKNGNQIVSFKYNDAKDFSEGLASVKLNDKWGFVDKNGNQIVPCLYDSANSFSEGLASVLLNKRYRFIDKNGNTIIE